MTLYAVELTVTGIFSASLMAESAQDAEREMRRRASELEPDSITFDAHAQELQHCDQCGEVHFGPVCPPQMKRASEIFKTLKVPE